MNDAVCHKIERLIEKYTADKEAVVRAKVYATFETSKATLQARYRVLCEVLDDLEKIKGECSGDKE